MAAASRRSRSHSAEISPDESLSPSSTNNDIRTQYKSRSSLPVFNLSPPTSPIHLQDQSYTLPRCTNREDILDGISYKTQHDNIIKVYISLTQFKMGTSKNPCSLQALGIIPKRYSVNEMLSTLRPLKGKSTSPVIVRGIIPSSPIALMNKLQPGDRIVMINGEIVTMKNIDSVLLSVTNEVILDVHKYMKDTPPDHTFSPPPSFVSDWSPVDHMTNITSPLVLLLTLDTNEDAPPEADILYRYPHNSKGNPLHDRFIQLRGVVTTLCDINNTYYNTNQTSCSFIIDGEFVSCIARKIEKEIMILLLPTKSITDHNIMLFQSIIDSFNSIYGSIRVGLHDDDSTQIMSSLFRSLLPNIPLSIDTVSSSVSFTSTLLPIKLQIPLKIRTLISSKLNQLDSGHVREESDSYNSIPCGSCILYKGYLIVSHLTTSLLRAVMSVCIINDLIITTSTNNNTIQTVIWKHVYTTPTDTPTTNECCIPGYYTYVLIMAMEQTIICHVLLTKSNIDTAPNNYCKLIQSIIEDLYSSGLLSECDTSILSQTPILTTADILLASLVTSTHSRTKTRTSIGSLRSLNTSGPPSGSDSDSEITGTSQWLYNTTPRKKKTSLKIKLSTSLRKSKSSHQSFRESQSSSLYYQTTNKPSYMLVAGNENLLLYFLTLDEGRGVVMCPCREQIGLQTVHKSLLQGFRDIANSIHCILHKQYHQTPLTYDSDTDNEQDVEQDVKRGVSHNTEGSPVLEHGVLMECAIPTHDSATLLYWVIGRLFINEGLELYICYQENMSQMTSEMMFKLLFGTPP